MRIPRIALILMLLPGCLAEPDTPPGDTTPSSEDKADYQWRTPDFIASGAKALRITPSDDNVTVTATFTHHEPQAREQSHCRVFVSGPDGSQVSAGWGRLFDNSLGLGLQGTHYATYDLGANNFATTFEYGATKLEKNQTYIYAAGVGSNKPLATHDEIRFDVSIQGDATIEELPARAFLCLEEPWDLAPPTYLERSGTTYMQDGHAQGTAIGLTFGWMNLDADITMTYEINGPQGPISAGSGPTDFECQFTGGRPGLYDIAVDEAVATELSVAVALLAIEGLDPRTTVCAN